MNCTTKSAIYVMELRFPASYSLSSLPKLPKRNSSFSYRHLLMSATMYGLKMHLLMSMPNFSSSNFSSPVT